MDLLGLEERARAVLTPSAYAYYSGGADDELTLDDNVAAWNRYRLRPRVLRDVAAVDLQTTVLGAPVAQPVLIAPTAYHRLAHPDGECATAIAAARAGAGLVVSTMATRRLEDVAAAAPDGLRWFQLYVHSDRELTSSLVQRAESAGYRALVVTLDTPRLGRRRRDGVGGFVLPEGLELANLAMAEVETVNLRDYAYAAFDPSLTTEAIAWLCAQTVLPVVVKGVLRGDDAAACIAAGARGVIVSNHGGRQLDGVVATCDALPEVVAAAGDRGEVYVDGGIRRGTDVLRALALGARAVMIGRPVLWGLALGGADGVADVMDAFAEETERAFALAGVATCADATGDLVTR